MKQARATPKTGMPWKQLLIGFFIGLLLCVVLIVTNCCGGKTSRDFAGQEHGNAGSSVSEASIETSPAHQQEEAEFDAGSGTASHEGTGGSTGTSPTISSSGAGGFVTTTAAGAAGSVGEAGANALVSANGGENSAAGASGAAESGGAAGVNNIGGAGGGDLYAAGTAGLSGDQQSDCWVNIWVDDPIFETGRIRQPFGRDQVVLARIKVQNSIPTDEIIRLGSIRVELDTSPNARGITNFRLQTDGTDTRYANVDSNPILSDGGVIFEHLDQETFNLRGGETQTLYFIADVMDEGVATLGELYTPHLHECTTVPCEAITVGLPPEDYQAGHVCIAQGPAQRRQARITEVVENLVIARNVMDPRIPSANQEHQVVAVVAMASLAERQEISQVENVYYQFSVTTNAEERLVGRDVSVWWLPAFAEEPTKVCEAVYRGGSFDCWPAPSNTLTNSSEDMVYVEIDTSGLTEGDTLEVSLVDLLWRDNWGTSVADQVGGLPVAGTTISYSAPGF